MNQSYHSQFGATTVSAEGSGQLAKYHSLPVAAGGIGGTIGRRQGGCEMTVRLLVEIVVVVIVIYVAVRFFRKRG